MRRKKKHSKKKKKPVVRVRNEFDWIVGISNKVDKHIQQINNSLRNESLDEIIYRTKNSIDSKYQRLNYDKNNPRLHQSIRTSKEKYNIMVDMYNNESVKKPWYERIFKRKQIWSKYKKYEL